MSEEDKCARKLRSRNVGCLEEEVTAQRKCNFRLLAILALMNRPHRVQNKTQ